MSITTDAGSILIDSLFQRPRTGARILDFST
jgi:hypothetical protein